MLDILLMTVSNIDFNSICEMLINNGVFALLFGWLFYDTRSEAKKREDRLLNHIERQGEALDKITDTMEKMDIRLTHIETKVKTKD